jgi:hypothetical protein
MPDVRETPRAVVKPLPNLRVVLPERVIPPLAAPRLASDATERAPEVTKVPPE